MAASARIVLSTSHMTTVADLLDHAEHLVALELTDRSANEIYELCFSRLTRPDPSSFLQQQDRSKGLNETVLMMGTDQRDLFVPILRSKAQFLNVGDRIADLGCGDGQTSKHLWAEIGHSVDVDLLDPNPSYLAAHKALIGVYQNVRLLDDTQASFDEWIDLGGTIGASRYKLILLLHSIYFTTDLKRLLHHLIDRLEPDAEVLLVFADELQGYTGKVVCNHLQSIDGALASAYERRIRERHAIFGIEGSSTNVALRTEILHAELNREDVDCVYFETQPSRIYGAALTDILAAAFITGLASMSDVVIDKKMREVKDLLARDPGSIGLAVESAGPRIRWLSVSQPQHVVILRKHR